jgi:FkbM family methyltransferase
MMKHIKQLFSEKLLKYPADSLPRRLSLLDVGARGGAQWPWIRVSPELMSVVLVEPDPAEAERLRQQLEKNEGGVVLPVALWRDQSELSIYMNRLPGTSSVYAPNLDLLNQFPESERLDVLKLMTISAQTIDGLASSGQMPVVDFAKIDVQGAELAILEGGVNHLSTNLVGLEVEVEFAQIYSGQPLFSDVDVFVREKLGLELWDLRKTYWKYKQGMHVPGPTKGRLVFGDALYFRSITGTENWLEAMTFEAARDKVFMLILCAMAYSYIDYAAAVLNAPVLTKYYDKQTRERLQGFVNGFGSGIRPFRNGNGYLYLMLDALARSFKPTHNGWATGGEGLGSRRRGPFWC